MRMPLDHMEIRPLQFGKKDPISNTFGWVRVHHDRTRRAHQGWDLQAKPGTLVYAVADGTTHAGFDGTGYGYWLSLEFTFLGQTYFAFYGHLSRYLTVVENQFVHEGQPIGMTGMSGNARHIHHDEAHLHFEIRKKEFPWSGPRGHRDPLAGRLDPGEIFGYGVYSSHR
jgi:murein DD-endopeptidase MepM/ murein hydrolase activator NlpD